MRIFITIPWFLPAYKAGGPIRSVANLVNQYSDAEFYIFTGDRELTGELLTNINRSQWLTFNSNTKIWYASKSGCKNQMIMQTEKLRPDVIFITGLFSWHFTLVPLIYCNAPKKIISVRGMLHPGALSQKTWKKRWYIRMMKWMGIPSRVYFHATDEEEKKFVQNIFGEKTKIFVAGNIPSGFEWQSLPWKTPGSLNLVTVALISPMKNILSVLQALGHLKSKVNYTIYGAVKDELYWKQCEEEIKNLPENIKVEYKGSVEFDRVLACLADNHVFIMPSESENFGHSLYEALSAGRPVITSENTPWKALRESHAGINVDSHSENEIADAIEFFSEMDSEELEKWSRGAHEYAVKNLNMDKWMEEYSVMFGEGI